MPENEPVWTFDPDAVALRRHQVDDAILQMIDALPK